jgi:hypothetical protein
VESPQDAGVAAQACGFPQPLAARALHPSD